MENMELESELQLNGIEEICKATFKKSATIYTHSFAIFFPVFALLVSFNSNRATSIVVFAICITAAVVMELSLYLGKKRYTALTRAKWQETVRETKVTYHYILGEAAISVLNTVSGGKAEVPYEVFNKYVETEHYALLITKSGQCIVFNKETARKNDVEGFVKQKNSAIK